MAHSDIPAVFGWGKCATHALHDEAIAFVDAMSASPGVQWTSLGPEWSGVRQVCLCPQLGANALPDAWLAAAVAHLGALLVSVD